MIRCRGVLNRFSVPLFFLLAYAWSWGCWFFIPKVLDVYRNVLQGDTPIITISSIPIYVRIGFVVAALSDTFGPAISAIILTAAINGKTGLREFFGRIVKWRVGLRYFLAALLIPPAMMIVRLGLILLLGGDLQTDIATTGFMAVLGIFISNFLVSGGQEELGFRGFAQPKLQEKFSPVITSLIIGVLWFFWHLPLYIWIPSASQYGQSLVFGVLAQISFCFTFTWIYNRTKSILLPMLLHATINSLGNILLVDVSGSQALIIAWAGVILPYFILGTWLIWRDGNKYQAASSPAVNELANEK